MLDTAVSWAKRETARLKELKIKRSDDLNISRNIDKRIGITIAMVAFGLEQLGKTGEAHVAYDETFGLTRAEDDYINERYVSFLVGLGEYKKAVEISEKCLESGKVSDKLNELYLETYQKLNGSADEAAAKIAARKAADKATMIADMKKEMLKKPAPDFNLRDINGNYVKLSDLKGRVVLVDFWATWCGPCKMSFPSLQKVQDKFKDNPDIQILAIDTREREKTEARREKKVKDFIAENKYTFRVLLDTDSISYSYGVKGIPAKFLIDRQGIIRFESKGFANEKKMISELEAQFEVLLEN